MGQLKKKTLEQAGFAMHVVMSRITEFFFNPATNYQLNGITTKA